ncbi:MAG TPA: flagellar protein FlgN [Spirochaetota bacterium]|nr:flagellar protein FlgN [Spirochaetota bacterium]
MKKQEMEIENILQSEITVYEDILLLEEEKGRAILKKDGRLIEDLSLRQESLVKEIDDLELERIRAVAGCRRPYSSSGTLEPTLNEIASVMERGQGARLLKTGAELKGLLQRIRDIQGVNARMIRDNIEFFEILIEGLKDSSSIKSGYNSEGRESSRMVNPVLFSIRA